MSPSELVVPLERARQRTEDLLEALSKEQLTRQISPLQSPLVWDLAHIGHFEELWLLRRVGGRSALSSEYDDLYDSFVHARGERGRLPILPPQAARAYVREVREAVLALLPELSHDDGDPLLERGFVVGMVVQHELQHAETMAQTLTLACLPGPAPQGPPEVSASGEVTVPGGPFTLGSTYLPRREGKILRARAAAIAGRTQARTLVELGAGSAKNIRLLLDGLDTAGTSERFVPLIAFLGSTIGNLYPEQRGRFLANLAIALARDDALLLGIDLVKDVARLEAAYNDSGGVTEAFVRNALTAVNRELEATFDQRRFVYEARWDPEHEWMDIGLRTRQAHTVSIHGLELDVAFEEGQPLRVEVSSKFRCEQLELETGHAGLRVESWWTDRAGDFAVALVLRDEAAGN